MTSRSDNPILVALDVETASDAHRLSKSLGDSVGGLKIGSTLFTSVGPSIVRDMVGAGHRVFLDLKFHDIPHQVAGAVAAATDLGVWMVNVHASGGADMMKAARDAAAERGARLGRARPLVIAVTVLTSMDAPTLNSVGVSASPLDQVLRLAMLVKNCGLDGVVASPQETAAIRNACGKDFAIVTPGIRGGAAAVAKADDQSRVATPAGAIAAGSSYLVVGRPITAAQDPRAAARAILSETTSR